MLEYVFKCLVCNRVFKVPYYRGEVNTLPEMFTVIEHEDDHIANSQEPDWDLDLKEGEIARTEDPI